MSSLRRPKKYSGYAKILSISLLSCRNWATSSAQAFQPIGRTGAQTPSSSSWWPSTCTSTRDSPLYAAGPADDDASPVAGSKGTARLSGGPKTAGATGAVDSALTLLSSDAASIVLGLLGIVVCLVNRVAHIDDYDALTSVAGGADALGRQSRADILAVFAAGAVLLNGVSKLDVTSALAESVVLEGTGLDRPVIYRDAIDGVGMDLTESSEDNLRWALESVLDATPANTVVLMMNGKNGWAPAAAAGIVAAGEEDLRWSVPNDRPTPILDRFLKESTKESYLPTLQALPGKTEFTYLPANAQEALLLPVPMGTSAAVLVLGSDTAKSCTPRDVAWCQVLAERIGSFFT